MKLTPAQRIAIRRMAEHHADIRRTIWWQGKLPAVVGRLERLGLVDGGRLTTAGRVVAELIDEPATCG